MKRLICLLLTLLLVMSLSLTAWAEDMDNLGVQQAQEESIVLSAYRMDDSLYSFVKFEGGVPSADGIRLAYHQDGAMEQLPVSWVRSCALDNPVHLVLLVDTSAAMKDKRDTLLVFAEEFLAKGPVNLSVTVATQARDFQVVAKDVTDGEQLKEILRGIVFDERYSANPMGGVINALSVCFDRESYQQGQMQNLLVFTNGAANMTSEERQTTVSQARAAMEKAPEILVHSVIVDGKNTKERTLLEQTNGGHFLLAEGQALETASAFAQSLREVHAVKVISANWATLELSGLSLKYNIRSGSDTVLHDVPLGVIADLSTREIIQVPITEPSESTDPTEQEEVPPTGETQPSTDPTASQPETEGTEPPQETTFEVTQISESSGGTPSGSSQGSKLWLYVGIGAVGLLVLVVVVILLLRHKDNNGIAMRLVVEYGSVPNIREWYYLKDSFYLGSGRGCDVVIPESIVDKKNTRVYLENGLIFVEDLGSRDGTLLGGMKLHGPNRLRSGDVVTVGNTSIRFLF